MKLAISPAFDRTLIYRIVSYVVETLKRKHDLSNAARRTIISTKLKQIEHVQFVSTLSKGRHFTIKSFNIVAVFGNKVDRCFDIVAGVDGALVGQISSSVTDHLAQITHISLPLPRSRMVQSSIFHFGLTFLSPSFSVPAFQRPHHFVW